jgi:predicted nucleotidyltransferase
MSDTLNLSWTDVRFSGLRPVCEMVEAALTQAGVDFYYLIGAQARDLWYAREEGVSRITRDIDFATLVADGAQYEAVKASLMEVHGFEVSKGNPAMARLRSPDGTR